MDHSLFNKFTSAIRNFDGDPHCTALRMTSSGTLTVQYAPFDVVNLGARVVLIGITPGRTQAINALKEAQRQLLAGAAPTMALASAKLTGAFSGAMRPNLVAMLDHIGLAAWLGLHSCESLFGADARLLQTTSVLPFPVFVDGENYNGTPDLVGTPVLRQLLLDHFLPAARQLGQAVLVPMGPVPTKALAWLVREGYVDQQRILSGMPHPSGANGERIQYFLGRKPISQLSSKTDPVKLDHARTELQRAVGALRRE